MFHRLRYAGFALESVAPIFALNTASNNFASPGSLRLKMFAVRTMVWAFSGMLKLDFCFSKFHRRAFFMASAMRDRFGSFSPLLDWSLPLTSSSPRAATPVAV
jgi:hypothetical protein